jgi:hypothetical protein
VHHSVTINEHDAGTPSTVATILDLYGDPSEGEIALKDVDEEMSVHKILMHEEPPPPDHVLLNYGGNNTECEWVTAKGSTHSTRDMGRCHDLLKELK